MEVAGNIVKPQASIHPHKFTLWVGLGSIVMMFAALTSAYIVKKNQSNWLAFDLPTMFWYSTIVIVLSSITLFLAAKMQLKNANSNFKTLLAITTLLGLVFLAMQFQGFAELTSKKIALIGPKSNSAASFLFVITGFHMVHVLGGVIVMCIMFAKSQFGKAKTITVLAIELLSTYWHFVGILWIYLFLFYNWVG